MPKSKRSKRSKNKTGFIGVDKSLSGKYRARIQINGTMKHIGYYVTAKQAAEAYDEAARKLGRPVSSLNYPNKAPVGYTPTQQALRSTNTSGFRGVRKNGPGFVANICIDGTRHNLGTYDIAEDAAMVRDRYIILKDLDDSLLNFPARKNDHPFKQPARRKKKTKSGFWGVVPSGSKKNPWQALVSINRDNVNLGSYAYAFQAACVYDEYCKTRKINPYKLNFGDANLSLEIQERVLPIIRSHLDVNSSSSSSSSSTSSSNNNVTTVNVTINDVVHVVPLKAKNGYDISYIFKIGTNVTNIVNLHGNPIYVA